MWTVAKANEMAFIYRKRRVSSCSPWFPPCEFSDTLTASWPGKELTPIMPACTELLVRPDSWLWFRGTLYSASAISAARFRMISCHRKHTHTHTHTHTQKVL